MPGTMHSRRVVLDGIEVVATPMGQDAVRTFLLVRGIGMGISCVAELTAGLRDHGRAVARGLRGFGDAPQPGAPTCSQSWSLWHPASPATNAPSGARWGS